MRRVLCLLLCLSTALLCACGGAPAPAETAASAPASGEDYAAFCADRLFADALPQEALPRPDRVIRSFEDFVWALDYLAFYRIADKVWFELEPDYAASLFNPYPEYQRAYQTADLADVYACQLDDGYFKTYGVVGLKYSISKDMAENPPQNIPEAPVVPSFDDLPAGDGELVLPIETDDRQPIPCENSEQLYWLAMNGYRPVPEPGSMAETLYEAAAGVLRQRVRADMTDFEKIKAVYDWLTTAVKYDRATAYSADTYLVTEQAYYLEGVFLHGCAVCDGKAKAMALLLNMLDLPCYRQTGAGPAGDHAWNMVRLDGKWYTICSTYGQRNLTESLGRILPNYSVFLSGRATAYGEDWDFVPQKHPEITALLEEDGFDSFALMGEKAGVSLKAADIAQAQALLAQVAAEHEPEYKVEFLYTGAEPEAFQQELIAYLSGMDHVNAVEIKHEGGQGYQVIFLSEQ